MINNWIKTQRVTLWSHNGQPKHGHQTVVPRGGGNVRVRGCAGGLRTPRTSFPHETTSFGWVGKGSWDRIPEILSPPSPPPVRWAPWPSRPPTQTAGTNPRETTPASTPWRRALGARDGTSPSRSRWAGWEICPEEGHRNKPPPAARLTSRRPALWRRSDLRRPDGFETNGSRNLCRANVGGGGRDMTCVFSRLGGATSDTVGINGVLCVPLIQIWANAGVWIVGMAQIRDTVHGMTKRGASNVPAQVWCYRGFGPMLSRGHGALESNVAFSDRRCSFPALTRWRRRWGNTQGSFLALSRLLRAADAALAPAPPPAPPAAPPPLLTPDGRIPAASSFSRSCRDFWCMAARAS